MNTIDIHTLNPYIRVALRSTVGAGWVIRQRIIFDYELIYVEAGSFHFGYAGAVHLCVPGQWILIRPGIPHIFEALTCSVSQPHIHFDLIYTENSPKIPISFRDLPQMSTEEKMLIQKDLFYDTPDTPFVHFSDPARAHDLFFNIIDCKSENNLFAAKGMLTELLGMLIADNFPNSLDTANRGAYDISQQIKDFIDSYQGINSNLDSLEKQFSYSKFYLTRQFKQRYGISLISYRNIRRMQLACELLKSESVSAVAEHLGFSSIYSFSRTFKNAFGMSPVCYKQHQK